MVGSVSACVCVDGCVSGKMCDFGLHLDCDCNFNFNSGFGFGSDFVFVVGGCMIA